MTDEHIPPKKAFNSSQIFLQTYEDFNKNTEAGTREHGQVVQGGFRRKTLCASCNNRTGGFYGGAFVDFAKACAAKVEEAVRNHDPLPTLAVKTFPLRVGKQILTMFLSVAGEAFCDKHPHLRNYVLEKSAWGRLPDMRLYCYGNPTVNSRIIPLTAQRSASGERLWIAEVGTWPLGYVLAIDCEIIGKPLCDISQLLDFQFNDEREIIVTLPLVPVSTMFPLDFRTSDEVQEDYLKNVNRHQTAPTEEERFELRRELSAYVMAWTVT